MECPAVEKSSKIKIVSAAPLFAEAVRAIHDRRSMGDMIDNLPERMFAMSFEGVEGIR